MSRVDDAINLIGETLQIQERTADFTAETPLFGFIPELDSMAVVSIITAMEEQYGFIVEDDEINAETFENIGALAGFIEQKLSA